MISETNVNTLIFYSDLIIGMFSNILIEANYLQKDILRIIPSNKNKDPIEHLSVGRVIRSEKELKNAFLSKLL